MKNHHDSFFKLLLAISLVMGLGAGATAGGEAGVLLKPVAFELLKNNQVSGSVTAAAGTKVVIVKRAGGKCLVESMGACAWVDASSIQLSGAPSAAAPLPGAAATTLKTDAAPAAAPTPAPKPMASLALAPAKPAISPWKLVGGPGAKPGDSKTLAKSSVGATAVPECKMLFCPGGEFPCGLTNSDSKTLGSFWMGETEVTSALWRAVVKLAGSNGYHFQNPGQGTDSQPVSSVSWRDALVWCNALSDLSGLTPVYMSRAGQVIRDSRDANGPACDQAVSAKANGFRLPTEWEWECAARWQGTKGGEQAKNRTGLVWTKGSSPSGGAEDSFDSVAVTGKIAPVKSKQPNGLGCYDMSGNVAEWCFGTQSAAAYIRNLRGGSWYQNHNYLQLGCGLGFFPYSAGKGTGFRLALSQTSFGTDYVVSGGPVSDPVPAPPRPIRTARVSTKIRWQNQKDACLEAPDAFPICRKGIGFIQLEEVQEESYNSKDPGLAADMDRKNQFLLKMFQSGAQVFETFATGKSSPGMSQSFVERCIKTMKEEEAAGLSVFGFWTFREDAFLFPHLDKNGKYDPAFYGEHLPPYTEVDPRIPSLQDVKNWRAAMAASDLKCKKDYKLILLLRENTMLKLLHPERMKGVEDHWKDQSLPFVKAPLPTPQKAAEILAFIRDNFDGVGEEVHIGFHKGGENRNPESLAATAKWALDNGKLGFMFLGGGNTVMEKHGLGYAKESYEYLFKLLQAQGVRPNDPRLLYFRQGGFQGIQQVPEEIHNDESPTVFSEVAWLDRRLSGPVITTNPALPLQPGHAWSYQPAAVTFGANTFSWSLSNAPKGMTIDPKTGLVQWAPFSHDKPSGTVTLTVTDGTESDSQSIDLGSR